MKNTLIYPKLHNQKNRDQMDNEPKYFRYTKIPYTQLHTQKCLLFRQNNRKYPKVPKNIRVKKPKIP